MARGPFKWLFCLILFSGSLPVRAQDTVVQVDRSTRTLNPEFFGFNGAQVIEGTSWRNPDFLKAVVRLDPALLRYPAGTVANYWDWEKGWFVTDRLPANYRRLPLTLNRLEEFQKGLVATQARPIFVLNMLTADLPNQLMMLRRAQKLNMPIRYIELGNEFYLKDKDNIERFPTPESYGQEANQWAKVIHEEFPSAKIAIVGATVTGQSDNRERNWGQGIYPNLGPINAITFHLYSGSGLVGGNNDLNRVAPNVLGAAFGRWQTFQQNDLQNVPMGKEVWVTEYNLFDRKVAIQGTWLHGMYVLTQSLLFLEDSRIQMVINHALVGSATFSAIFDDSEGFQLTGFISPPNPPITKPFTLTASGYSLRMFSKATRGMNSAQKLSFDPNPAVRTSRGTQYPTLLGWTFSGSNSRQTLVVNLGSTAQTIRYPTRTANRFEQLSALPATLVVQLKNLTTKTGTLGKSLVLPPFSITRLY